MQYTEQLQHLCEVLNTGIAHRIPPQDSVKQMNALEIDIRRKAFARDGAHIEVVRGLQLTVQPGEFVAVLGPSGCGKSTTLQIAAGLDADFEGSVNYGPGVEDHLAYVFQQPVLTCLSQLVSLRERRERDAAW